MMLESYLPVANVLWSTDTFEVIDAGQSPAAMRENLAGGGRFATAHHVGDTVVLTRDQFGLNKLYFAIDRDRGVVAANYLADLVDGGVPFDAIYAVPAGTSAAVDAQTRTIRLDRHYTLATDPISTDPGRELVRVRDRLSHHIAAVAASRPCATAAVCLSGGLDSGLIAALVRAHFTNVVTYTYAFDDHTGQLSPDAVAAEQLARRLDMPFRLVTADADKILAALPRAYRFGQDWRDFNVHCAIVNDILAETIAADLTATDGPVLVFTGDLMNELLGDYTPIRYRGQDFYTLPNVPPDRLRISLVRGLQCGDREVGIFAARGLTTVQPYAQIGTQLLQIPTRFPKPEIIRALAGTLLPDESYDRPKARAQIGGPDVTTGILPLLVDSGRVGSRLEHEFCETIGVTDRRSLRDRIRAGIYRFPSQFPAEMT